MRGQETLSDRITSPDYEMYLWLRQALKGRTLVDLELSTIKLGLDEYSFSRFDYARLNVWGRVATRSLNFKFGISDEVDFEVLLTRGTRVIVAPATATAVLRLLESSSVAIPTDEWDPEGKFARSGSPTNVTREEAIALVSNPPMPGEKLPIIWP